MRSRRVHPSATLVIAGIAVLGALGAILWVLFLVRGEDSPLEPPSSPEAVVGTPAATSMATPNATPVGPVYVAPTVMPGSLPDLLRYAPDRLAGNSLPLNDIARFADIDGWMTARGVPKPSGPDDPAFAAWNAELDALAIPEIFVARATDEAWRQTYGFQLMDIGQVLAVGQSPDYVIVMRGDFDPEALNAAWVQSGYQAVRAEGSTIWSLFPGDAVDLSAPASRPALGNLNNMVLLDDGTLIATSRLSRMEETLRVVRGEIPSLADHETIAALLRTGAGSESLATAMIVKGTLLAMDPATPPPGTPRPDVMSVDAATPDSTPAPRRPVPPAELVLAGLERPATAEPDAPPVMRLVVVYPSADDATYALAWSNRAWREGVSGVTGEPFTRRLTPLDGRVIGTGQDVALLVMRVRPVDGAPDWLAVLDERDLGFVMWPWAPE